jgi:hemerythrin-like domain-containing protein
MDAIELLTEDHRRVERLFSAIEARRDEGRDASFATLVRGLVSDLSVHSEMEEWTVYAEARRAIPDGEELVRHAIGAHQKVKDLLVLLEGASGAEPDFQQKLAELRNMVREHVEEEEREFFPALVRGLGKPRLVELGEAMKRAKEKPGTELHGQLEQAKSPVGTVRATSEEAIEKRQRKSPHRASPSASGGKPARRTSRA